MKAVILHGGQGTRLRPLTHTGPKQLIKIGGKAVSQWGIEALRDAGIEEFAIILGDNFPEKVIEYYGDGTKLGIKITYIYQGKARGLADAVYKAKDFVRDENFVVYLGDNVVLQGLDLIAGDGNYNAILLAKVSNPQRFGVAVVKDNKVINLVEKPKDLISNLALVGVYRFTPDIFKEIQRLKPSWRGELEITDAIQGLVNDNVEVKYKIIEGWWKDTGTPEDLLEANYVLLDTYSRKEIDGKIKESEINGRVLSSNATIENSRIIGPTTIGEGTIIKNSYIGPYVSVGDNVIIEDSEILSNTLILNGARISSVTLSDSVIGANAKIYRNESKPKVLKLIVGENSVIKI
ncbi:MULTISPECIES: glucose-1-phosphate thymidylyltransferase [Acidianus]|uniref:Glucose-1-phosphate thymidylyltransferase n=1 Tax=Candidatus Acidianus copahuensis TaxID=1160895 RepID=A0A031LX24_9CREN|nr:MULTISPECIES: glucose-1-phosphate thymidylyltransferase [Acidianus]EZQ12034.1 glucose-1-phosphate thymidylyltransferase [Candidatus Acidianus copahuensis]NON61419.1 glucose-1-phosphate thymidylyltransferase [Acidianus sp. RZ1]